MISEDGKMRETDVLDTKGVWRELWLGLGHRQRRRRHRGGYAYGRLGPKQANVF